MNISNDTVTVVETRVVSLRLDDTALYDQLKQQLNLDPGFVIKRAVYIIPCGGDYSNMELSLSEIEIKVTLERVQ